MNIILGYPLVDHVKMKELHSLALHLMTFNAFTLAQVLMHGFLAPRTSINQVLCQHPFTLYAEHVCYNVTSILKCVGPITFTHCCTLTHVCCTLRRSLKDRQNLRVFHFRVYTDI